MALGLHSFYGYSTGETNRIANREDYFIGCFEGDHFNDQRFDLFIKKVVQHLINVYGIGHFSYYWSPAIVQPYRARTKQQKLNTAIKKATNKHRLKIEQIKLSGYLFEAAFIAEEENRLSLRKEVLQKRYR